jgi:hypothetical protein
MVTRQTGIRFFELGEKWRNAWISGIHVNEIAKTALQNPQIVSRAIWLARVPEDIKNRMKTYPDIFTRQILLDTFAAKRRQCEKDGFKKLIAEVERLIEKGGGTKPNLKKTNKINRNRPSQKTPNAKAKLKINPIYNIGEALTAELKIKKKLDVHCRVSFDKSGGGEIRIFFENNDELDKIIAKLN